MAEQVPRQPEVPVPVLVAQVVDAFLSETVPGTEGPHDPQVQPQNLPAAPAVRAVEVLVILLLQGLFSWR